MEIRIYYMLSIFHYQSNLFRFDKLYDNPGAVSHLKRIPLNNQFTRDLLVEDISGFGRDRCSVVTDDIMVCGTTKLVWSRIAISANIKSQALHSLDTSIISGRGLRPSESRITAIRSVVDWSTTLVVSFQISRQPLVQWKTLSRHQTTTTRRNNQKSF